MDEQLLQQAIAPAVAARTRWQGRASTEQSLPNEFYRKAAEKFREACTAVEPHFDIRLADKDVLNSLYAWVWKFDYCNALGLDYDKGLWLYGSMGRGKTLALKVLWRYMSWIGRAARKQDYRIGLKWCSASELATLYAADGQPVLAAFCAPNVNLVIDEVGREPNPASNYGTKLDVIQYVLQTRYENRHESVTCVTTNMGLEEIAGAYGDYIADRCLEMFNFIEFKGDSLRC